MEDEYKRRLDEDLYRIECELELLACKAPLDVLAICRRIREMMIVKKAETDANAAWRHDAKRRGKEV